MTRRGRWITAIVAAVILIPVAAYVFLWFAFSANEKPSNIVAFRPTSFVANADSKFFYSTGNELKYSDQIDPQAPTLLRGRIKNFLVSPDGTKIAAVANGELVIVGTESLLRHVTAVDSIYREPKPNGQQFFRDDDFQWSKDSKSLYLIRDEFYGSKGSQLFSEKGELWKYDLEAGSLQLVLKPFKAYNYFFGAKGIYFSEPTAKGDLQLKYFNGTQPTNVGDPDESEITLEPEDKGKAEKPFFSFSIIDYEKALRSSMDVQTQADANGPERLIIRGQTFLEISQGESFKGPYFCSEMLRSVFLPGDRYFVFNVPYCGNYNGQLVIDTTSGRYSALPKDAVVFLTLNTDTYQKYRITGGGIEGK
jgi:hypothetical protein